MKIAKSLVLSLLMCLTSLSTWAQVEFHQGDFASLLAKAKEENKPILIDAFTVWCGPCKMLDKQVFQDPEAADFINENFIAYKLDMEKGEGPFVAMKFRINAYPSTLFLSEEGFLLTKNIGFPGKEGYVEWCKAVEGDTYRPFENISASKMEMNFPKFYKMSFTSDQWKRKRPTLESINTYLDGQKGRSLFSEESWSVISVLAPYGHNKLNWVLENKVELKRLYPAEEIDGVMDRIIGIKSDSLVKLKMADGDMKLRKIMDEFGIEDEEAINSNLVNYYFRAKEWSKLLDFSIEMAKDGEPNVNMINSICWSIYEKEDNVDLLKKAISTMEKVLDENSDPNALDTLAHLYFKTKQNEKGKKWAELALEKGKAKEMPMKETEQLLEKLK